MPQVLWLYDWDLGDRHWNSYARIDGRAVSLAKTSQYELLE